MVSGGPIGRESASQLVATRLRSDILSGNPPPGERLVVRDLVASLGVSHVPIREALRELEAEGLVESRLNRGVVVAGVDIGELHDLYRIRRLLEVDAVARAFDAYDEEHLAHADELFQDLLELAPERGNGAWWGVHRDYHWAFLEPGLSDWATRLLKLVWQSSERYQRLYTLVFGSADEANAEHREILAAARGDDRDVFVDAWLHHLDRTEETIASGYHARHDGDLDRSGPAADRDEGPAGG